MKKYAFLRKYKFLVSFITSMAIVSALRLLSIQLPYILTFVLMLILLNVFIDLIYNKTNENQQ